MQERSGLLTALALVKGKLRDIDKAFNGDVPTRVAAEVKELTVSATYLEQKLVELNEKEGLYEDRRKDGYIYPYYDPYTAIP